MTTEPSAAPGFRGGVYKVYPEEQGPIPGSLKPVGRLPFTDDEDDLVRRLSGALLAGLLENHDALPYLLKHKTSIVPDETGALRVRCSVCHSNRGCEHRPWPTTNKLMLDLWHDQRTRPIFERLQLEVIEE